MRHRHFMLVLVLDAVLDAASLIHDREGAGCSPSQDEDQSQREKGPESVARVHFREDAFQERQSSATDLVLAKSEGHGQRSCQFVAC